MGNELSPGDWQNAYKAPTPALYHEGPTALAVGARNRNDDIPTLCPNCGTPFSTLRRPKRRMQRKAMVIAAIGFLVCAAVSIPIWIVLLLTVIAASNDFRVFIGAPIVALVIGSLASRPVFKWATAIPFVTRLHCKKCNWDGAFYTTVNHSVLSPPPLN